MKRLFLMITVLLAGCLLGFTSAARQKAGEQAELQSVLSKMDALSATFRSAQANFEWETYEKVIDEVDDVETGTVYYRRNGKDLEMMAEVKKAGNNLATLTSQPKYVLYSQGKVRLYQPKVDTVTLFDVGQSHPDFESYVVLGFGGSGQDLLKVFDVTYAGQENLNGVTTAKLQLVPKSEKIRGTYKLIFLWIDLDKGVSVQQKFISPQDDYRLAKYSEIQVNGKKLPDEVFKLKTTSKTQTISPRG